MIVSLNSIEPVKKFAEIILKSEKHIIVIIRNYRMDAGSIMGLFSLDLTNPIKLKFPWE